MVTRRAERTDPETPTGDVDGEPVSVTATVLNGALPGGYALRSPVSVAVWREGTEVVADAPDLNIHAFGADADAAMANLGARIVDQYARLEDLGDRLAPRMARERDRLRDLLVAPRA